MNRQPFAAVDAETGLPLDVHLCRDPASDSDRAHVHDEDGTIYFRHQPGDPPHDANDPGAIETIAFSDGCDHTSMILVARADYEAAIKAADEPAKHEGIFVANADGTFYCADCIPAEVDVSLDETQVWQEYSSGWTAPCVCRECKLSIPVYVDVEPAAEALRAAMADKARGGASS
jgi:hypothetical protein